MSRALATVLAWTLGCALGRVAVARDVADAAATARFNGVWLTANVTKPLLTDAGNPPPLLPEAKKIYEAHLAARQAGQLSFDGTSVCQPPGLPRVYQSGMPFEIQVEEKFVHFLYQWGRNNRVVELNTTHDQQAQFAPYYFGWATGEWQGGALTIDSVLFNDSTLLDYSGLPHSIDMHLLERWSISTDGRLLTAKFTIDDAANYSAPWSTTLRLKRAPDGTEIQEDICLERLKLVGAR
jgi:hypothetical protein